MSKYAVGQHLVINGGSESNRETLPEHWLLHSFDDGEVVKVLDVDHNTDEYGYTIYLVEAQDGVYGYVSGADLEEAANLIAENQEAVTEVERLTEDCRFNRWAREQVEVERDALAARLAAVEATLEETRPIERDPYDPCEGAAIGTWEGVAEAVRKALDGGAHRAYPGLAWEQKQEQQRQEDRAAGRAVPSDHTTTNGRRAEAARLHAGMVRRREERATRAAGRAETTTTTDTTKETDR